MSQQPSDPNSPRTGGTLVSEGPGQAPAPAGYNSAGAPGVAVQLPGQQNPAAAPVSAQGQQPPPGDPSGAAPGGTGGLPPAPAARGGNHANDDQLMTGGKRTVYEFTGEFSEENRSGGRHDTFFGDAAELSLADGAGPEERQSSNLRGTSMPLVIGAVVLLLGAAVVGGIALLSGPKASEGDAPDPGVSAADASAAAAEPAPAAPAATTDAAAADTEGGTGDASGDAEADAAAEAKAAEEAAAKKAEEEAAAAAKKAEEEAAAKKAAEEAAAKKKKSTGSTTKKKKKSSNSGSGSGSGSGSSSKKKPLSITPSSKPREGKDFGNLPEP